MYDVEEGRLAQLVALSRKLGFEDDYMHWKKQLEEYRQTKAQNANQM